MIHRNLIQELSWFELVEDLERIGTADAVLIVLVNSPLLHNIGWTLFCGNINVAHIVRVIVDVVSLSLMNVEVALSIS